MVKVSVIIPCYNQEQYISECLDSVLAQTFNDYEIIVVNDGSRDNSQGIIQEYAKKYPFITAINQENSGVVISRNKAISLAKGQYILPLDGDDRIAPTYLEKAVKILDKNGADIVYCEAELFGKEQGKWKIPDYSFPEILSYNCIFCSALFRKSDWENVGGYKEEMIYGLEDYEMWLSMIERGAKVYQIPEVLFFYRKQDISRTSILDSEKKANMTWNTIFEFHKDLYLRHKKHLLGGVRNRFYKLYPPFFYKEKTKDYKLYHIGRLIIGLRRNHA